ncbi:MAG: 4Fe-4S dicluster domain-containing protein [Synergistaceae bacterium]|jgi:Na+-translocating ferredoxin:NAD+ oxidoreductase RNF subunit RnfB|nr:4Fe-4S dicluster domain-containing protein [Synergistaceae bacterium]
MLSEEVPLGIEVKHRACKRCARCIRTCPTQAMRIYGGEVRVRSKLCIGCGECIRVCPWKAIAVRQDSWDDIRRNRNLLLTADPAFYVQTGSCGKAGFLSDSLAKMGFEDISEYISIAYDLAALAIAKQLNARKRGLPLISTYCPAVLRLIQLNHPELIEHIADVESPLEIGVGYWRKTTGRPEKVALIAPCPAMSQLQNAPTGRARSNFDHVFIIKQVIRNLIKEGAKVDELPSSFERNGRWLKWARQGGETKHISAMLGRPLQAVVATGIRDVKELLNELELGRLGCVEYLECRMCSQGCLGGVATAESRFTSLVRLQNLDADWTLTPEERKRLLSLYETGIWRFDEPVQPRAQEALSEDIPTAMERLKKMNEFLAALPGIDCGSCGRPSCRAMAADLARDEGEITDCIFKLKERITKLSTQIFELCAKTPPTSLEAHGGLDAGGREPESGGGSP